MKRNLSLILALLVIGGWLLTSDAPTHGAVFNARDYGAVGDDQSDNTDAFSKCLAAIVADGGGQMFVPAGVYRGRIVIPPVTPPIPSWITVEIFGEGEPTPVFGTVGSFPLRDQGTIVKCLAESGAAVLSAGESPNSLYGGFSAVNVVVRNLEVRTSDNPGIGGIDLHSALQCRIENVFINTGVYSVQAAKPTRGAKGLITPANNNAALTILKNVIVTGYHTGIVANEHTDADHIVVAGNINGLEFPFAHHASRFGRVGAFRNTHHITVTGKHGFSIQQLDIEKAGPDQTDAGNAWQATVSDLHDPDNRGVGDLNYWVVVGSVGETDDFTRTGGKAIRARRIGSAATGDESASRTRLFLQPDIGVKDVDACLIGEVHPQSERFYVRLGNYGKTTPLVPQVWDAGRFTGLQVPAGCQRGLSPAADTTAVQVHGREIGIWIDSDHPRPSIGALLPITPAFWWWDQSRAPMPFNEADRELSMSFDLKVPTSVRDGKAEVYVTVNFLFQDPHSQQSLWLAAALFDPRGEASFPDTVHMDDWEAGTQLPIVSSALNTKSLYLHPGPGSSVFTDTPFADYRRIEVRVSAAELLAALIAMRKAVPGRAAASEDPRDYQLAHFNINPEVYAPPGSRGRLGLSIRDVRVELIGR